MRRYLLWMAPLLLATLFLLGVDNAQAHVKWFTDFSFGDEPRDFGQVIGPLFIGLTLLSALVIGGLVLVEGRLENVSWYKRLNDWLEGHRDQSVLIMRIGMGVTLLLSWQADTMLSPDLATGPVVGWIQFFLASLLLFQTTTPMAGLGVLGLYGLGIYEYGLFYMLDYLIFVGVGYYLIVTQIEDRRISGTAIPALYATLGFSLAWLALEKLVYPQWSLYILEQNPQLALGFDFQFFIYGAAFVELALGYLLIINLLQRPFSLVITLVFFTTTLVFGKVEVIGHTILHAALIVFVIEGPGRIYRAPITFHQRLPLRIAFAAVNFILFLILIMVPYIYGAQSIYEQQETEQTAIFNEQIN
ncbi:MAG: hypothetical protein R6X32_12740 [Chloroflexota bacterium]